MFKFVLIFHGNEFNIMEQNKVNEMNFIIIWKLNHTKYIYIHIVMYVVSLNYNISVRLQLNVKQFV